CHLPGRPANAKYRWTKRFEGAEVDALVASLGVGHERRLVPRERGVSGRAAALRVVGDGGTAELRGELVIRKRFNNLPSSAFVVDPDGAAFVFRGAGWGHGVGMCQTGAIGRALRGQGYRDILRHYFNGAEVSKIY
ncbi:MAG: SpoIID/LytB domain-containing protein, partial [Deltaproteobacteria bacterium]